MGVKENLNMYWLAGTGLGIWMLFVQAPPYLASIEIRPLLWIHLMGVYPIYVACMHNTLITPSTFPWARNVHVWIGRVGLTLGVVGFVTGVILEWNYLDPEEFGNAIGVTVGGSIQMTAQFFGWRAIKRFQRFKKELSELDPVSTTCQEKIDGIKKNRDEALASHIYNMIGVFLLGCGIPALMRLPIEQAEWVVFVLIGVSVLLFFFYGRMFEKRIENRGAATNDKMDTKVVNDDDADDDEKANMEGKALEAKTDQNSPIEVEYDAEKQ